MWYTTGWKFACTEKSYKVQSIFAPLSWRFLLAQHDTLCQLIHLKITTAYRFLFWCFRASSHWKMRLYFYRLGLPSITSPSPKTKLFENALHFSLSFLHLSPIFLMQYSKLLTRRMSAKSMSHQILYSSCGGAFSSTVSRTSYFGKFIGLEG